MANAQITLKISEVREGKALVEIEGDLNRVGEAIGRNTNAAKGFARGVEQIGGKMGPMVENILKLFKGIATGGLWEIGAQAVQMVFNLWKQTSKKLFDSLLAAKSSVIDSYGDTTNKVLDSIRKTSLATQKVIKENLKLRQQEIGNLENMALAENELKREQEKKSRLDKGLDANDPWVDALYNKNALKIRQEAESKKVDDDIVATQQSLNKAKSVKDAQEKIKREATEKLNKIEQTQSDFFNALFDSKATIYEKNFAARRGRGDYNNDEWIKSHTSDKEYAQYLAWKKNANTLRGIISKARSGSGESSTEIVNIEAQLKVKEEARKILKTKHAAEMLKAENILRQITAEDIKKVDQESSEKKKKAQHFSEEIAKGKAEEEKKQHEESIRAEKEAADKKKKIADEAEKKKREEASKTAQKLKETGAAELKVIDEKIAAERKEAQERENVAARARGKSFTQWIRDDRDRSEAEAKEKRRQARRINDAQKELVRLENDRRKGFGAPNLKRIQQLREFILNQDPKNNPALKRAEELEKERADLAKKTEKTLSDILKVLKNDVAL